METLKIQNLLERNLMYLRKSNICPHKQEGSEVISLDAGLRMDGIPALYLWDVVREVLHYFNDVLHGESRREMSKRSSCHKRKTFSLQRHALHFEDNEAVIKMIIKGRTHRVAPDLRLLNIMSSKRENLEKKNERWQNRS